MPTAYVSHSLGSQWDCNRFIEHEQMRHTLALGSERRASGTVSAYISRLNKPPKSSEDLVCRLRGGPPQSALIKPRSLLTDSEFVLYYEHKYRY